MKASMNRLKLQMLILLLIAIVCFMIGGIRFIHSMVIKAICNETAQGAIVNVEKRKQLNAKYLIIDYRADVKYTPKGENTEITFRTNWTSSELRKKEETVVHYAPNHPKTAFIEQAPPDIGLGDFIIGFVFLNVGVVLFVISKYKKSSIGMQDDEHWD